MPSSPCPSPESIFWLGVWRGTSRSPRRRVDLDQIEGLSVSGSLPSLGSREETKLDRSMLGTCLRTRTHSETIISPFPGRHQCCSRRAVHPAYHCVLWSWLAVRPASLSRMSGPWNLRTPRTSQRCWVSAGHCLNPR